MAKFEDLCSGVFVCLCLAAIIIYMIHFQFEQYLVEKNGKLIDMSTGRIYEKKEQPYPLRIKALIRSSASGAIRGFLMGILIGGLEGALITAMTLGLVNPIMLTLEHHC